VWLRSAEYDPCLPAESGREVAMASSWRILSRSSAFVRRSRGPCSR